MSEEVILCSRCKCFPATTGKRCERCIQYAIKYRSENRPRLLEYGRKYYKEHPRDRGDYVKLWYLRNKDRIREEARNNYKENRIELLDKRRKYTYGIDGDTYRRMLETQGGVCAVEGCGSSIRLSVDHNHITGKVREILCCNCNSAIGHLKESAERAERVAAYIRKHNTK